MKRQKIESLICEKKTIFYEKMRTETNLLNQKPINALKVNFLIFYNSFWKKDFIHKHLQFMTSEVHLDMKDVTR